MAESVMGCVILSRSLFSSPYFDRIFHISVLYYVSEKWKQSLIHSQEMKKENEDLCFYRASSAKPPVWFQ